MLGDFFTKPMQGKQHLKLRQALLGHKPISSLCTPSTQTKECVGANTTNSFGSRGGSLFFCPKLKALLLLMT